MNEIIKKKVVELSDEQINNVSGGNALLILSNGTYKRAVICKYSSVTASEFNSRFYSKYANNGCRHFDGPNVDKDCTACKYYKKLSPIYYNEAEDVPHLCR